VFRCADRLQRFLRSRTSMLHSAWPQPLALGGYPKIELRLGYGPTPEGPATSEHVTARVAARQSQRR